MEYRVKGKGRRLRGIGCKGGRQPQGAGLAEVPRSVQGGAEPFLPSSTDGGAMRVSFVHVQCAGLWRVPLPAKMRNVSGEMVSGDVYAQKAP